MRLSILSVALLASSNLWAAEPEPKDVFHQRIMPIFNSPDPSSCVQCHLSSVDLKDYILPSSRETFIALRDQDLIDVRRPAESKILHLIAMGDTDSDSLAKRIHEKNRRAEYEAFASWIKACCDDKELIKASKSEIHVSNAAGPQKPLEVVRHARKDRILESFTRSVWSQRMRCFPCHTPGEIDPSNPNHKVAKKRYEDFVAKYGGRMNVFRDTPEATLRSLAASSRKTSGDDLPLINLDNPLQSLLLQKPTSKLPPKGDDGKLRSPSSAMPVSHMGGIKMHKDDYSYKAFAAWLEDYAKSVKGEYTDAAELPRSKWIGTQKIIRIKGLPSDWPNLSTVQIFVHLPNESGWQDSPIAFTQTKLTPRKIVNGALFEIEEINPTSGKDQAPLEPGRVQLRVFLDRENRVSQSPAVFLNDRVPDAIAVVEARFVDGFKNADVVDAAQLTFSNE